jgi:hypothetical protein
MSSLNNAPETKCREANLGSKLLKYGLAIYFSGMLFGLFCRDQIRDLGQIQDELNAAKAVITKKADKNPLAENTNQPASLNRSGGDTSQGPSTDAETHLAAAEEAIRQKINFFKVADGFSSFLGLLGWILLGLGSRFFLQHNQQKGR